MTVSHGGVICAGGGKVRKILPMVSKMRCHSAKCVVGAVCLGLFLLILDSLSLLKKFSSRVPNLVPINRTHVSAGGK